MQVLDYSAGLPGAAAIKAAGFAGAVRYIGLPGYTKNTSRAELDDFDRHGLGMALVWEHFATDWRGGYQAGAAAMRRSLDHAWAIGWPADRRPIYMAVDQDVVTQTEFDVAMEYLDGAADAHQGPGSTGPYGEHDVCARSAAAGFAWQWQCRAWSGTPPRLFSGRRLYQHVGLVTVGGIGCDFNDVLVDDWGQHNHQPAQRKPAEEEFEMSGFNGFSVEITTGDDPLLPAGFGILVDVHNRIATGWSAADLRVSALEARDRHIGCSPAIARDLLGKYGLPVPAPTDAVLVRIEQHNADDAAATAVSADQRAAAAGQ